MATSFTMSQTNQQGIKTTRSVTNINPEATLDKIAALAKAMNALTTNRLGEVVRIDKTDVNTSETFENITYLFDKIDDNNAVSFNGSTMTINATTAADTSPIINARLSVKTQQLNPTIIPMKVLFGCPHISIDSSSDGVNTTLNIYYVKGDAVTPGTVTITIPSGQVTIGTAIFKYNPLTITVTVVE